jgi:hypothetical protein
MDRCKSQMYLLHYNYKELRCETSINLEPACLSVILALPQFYNDSGYIYEFLKSRIELVIFYLICNHYLHS